MTPDLPQIPDSVQRRWSLGYEDLEPELEAAADAAIAAAMQKIRAAHLAEMGGRQCDRGDE